MVIAARKLTYADYEKIPPDGFRHEIIEGEELMTPAPNPSHQTALLNIARVLADHAKARKVGRVFVAPTDVVLSEHDIVEPDVFFIAEARAGIIGPKYIEGAPDLVVEVISPSTASHDRGAKRALYDRAGVREYWIVDLPARTVEILEFGSPRRTRVYQEGQSFETAVLPGLTVRVDDLFLP
jgi:Uma2 family endonuclease